MGMSRGCLNYVCLVRKLSDGSFCIPCCGCVIQHKACNMSKNDGEQGSTAGDIRRSFLRVGGVLHFMMTN